MKKEKGKLFNALRNDFFAGVTVLIPVVGTIFIVRFFVIKVNNVLLDPIMNLLTPAARWTDIQFVSAAVKMAILILILASIVLLGLLVKSYFIRRLISLGESILLRVPFVNRIYSVIQQVSGTFLSKKEELYNKVVMIEYPRKGCFVLGLMTTSCSGEIAEKLQDGFVNVFVPTTPNPTSGFLVMVNRNEVVELSLSAEDAMKVIVSSGIVMPEKKVASTLSEKRSK